MNEESKEALQKEVATLRERVKKLEKEWLEEYRVIQLLVAAEFVHKDKVQQARELIRR